MAAAGTKASSSFDNLPLAGKIFILVLLLGVVSAIYYFGFHMQVAEQIEHEHQRYGQLQDERSRAEQRQHTYLRLVQELAAREALDVRTAGSSLPTRRSRRSSRT
jgi:hypothetical protein